MVNQYRLKRVWTDLLISALVTHHTDGFDRKKNRERLADLVIKSSGANLLDVNVVGLLQNFDLVAGDRTENTDSETWAWEGVTANEVGGDAKETAKRADFIYANMESNKIRA